VGRVALLDFVVSAAGFRQAPRRRLYQQELPLCQLGQLAENLVAGGLSDCACTSVYSSSCLMILALYKF
jgi:hypothetical protein